MNKTVSILGCGWLGTAVGKGLIRKNYRVKGSTSLAKEYIELEKTGISTFYIKIGPEAIEIDYHSFFNTDILIVSFPPGRSKLVNQIFPQQISRLTEVIVKMGIKNVLFISSTSVYEPLNREVKEGMEGNPQKSVGKALLAAEKLLMENNNFRTTVLRFGGLIGADRNPAEFIKGNKSVSPESPVNLIHRDDCVNIIGKIIENNVWGEVFNASCPDHPTKKEFYTKAAKISGLPVPDFIEEPISYKIVNSNKLIKKLDYVFEYNSPMDYLKEVEEWAYRI